MEWHQFLYFFKNCNFSFHVSKTASEALNTSNFTWHQTRLKQNLNHNMKAINQPEYTSQKAKNVFLIVFDLNDTWQLCPLTSYKKMTFSTMIWSISTIHTISYLFIHLTNLTEISPHYFKIKEIKCAFLFALKSFSSEIFVSRWQHCT